jgi:hypothetical protein
MQHLPSLITEDELKSRREGNENADSDYLPVIVKCYRFICELNCLCNNVNILKFNYFVRVLPSLCSRGELKRREEVVPFNCYFCTVERYISKRFYFS